MSAIHFLEWYFNFAYVRTHWRNFTVYYLFKVIYLSPSRTCIHLNSGIEIKKATEARLS